MTRSRSPARVLALIAGALTLLPARALGQKHERDRISREEIETSPKRSDFIYDVIRTLRPRFLEPARGIRRVGAELSSGAPGRSDRRVAGPGGSNDLVAEVFVDGHHAGGVDILKSIPAEQVEEVRYYAPDKAEEEFGGTLGAGGAIVLKMHQAPRPDQPRPPGGGLRGE